jgi:hypothetical protein
LLYAYSKFPSQCFWQCPLTGPVVLTWDSHYEPPVVKRSDSDHHRAGSDIPGPRWRSNRCLASLIDATIYL